MAMKLLDLYRAMMRTAGLTVTEDCLVSSKLLDQVQPVMLKGKRLALPSQEILMRQDKSDIVVFHPLAEIIVRGESEVLEKYRKMCMVRLNDVAAALMSELLTISRDVASQKNLTPDQTEFLLKVKDVDEKLIGEKGLWYKVLEAMPHDQTSRRVVTIFLKKTGSVAGKRYKRVGVVHFPLYDELNKAPTVTVVPATKKGEKDTKVTEYDIYGVKCRAKDREILKALLEYIFPNIGNPDAYNRGSESETAANLDALMRSMLTVIEALNAVTETFEDRLNKSDQTADELLIEAEWAEAFINIDTMVNESRKVPPQPGNEGRLDENDQSVSGMQPQIQPKPGLHTPAPPPMHPAQQVQPIQPVQSSAPAQTPASAPAASGNQPLDSFLAQREQERERQRQFEQGWRGVTHQTAAPAPQAQAPYNPAASFVPGGQAAYYPQQMQPVQPVHTGRGLDFGSVLASNPAMLYATGGPGMQPMQPPPQTSRFFAQFAQPSMYPQMQPTGYAPAAQGYYPQTGYQRSI